MNEDRDDAKIGVIHYNFPGYSMEEFLSYAESTGFEYVELQIGDVWEEKEEGFDEAMGKAKALRAQVDSHGRAPSAVAARNDFVQLDPGAVKAEAERMEKVCRLAEILGTRILRTEGGRPKDSVPEERWVEAISGCLTECLDFLEDGDFYLAVDNHGLVTNDGDLEVEIFKAVDSRHVGANMDTMNYRWFGHELDTVYRFWEIVAPYALHTHMKDGLGSRSDYVCMPLGEGELDLGRAIAALKKAGYGGVWCVEYEGKEDPAIGYRKGLEFLRRNL